MYRKLVVTILLASAGLLRLPAQNSSGQVDSLVRLLSAQKMEIIDDHGNSLRKVTGPARFLHNDTFLICDTALWSVSKAEIEAIGNVRILQNETVLTGDKLTYYIDQDLAEFRGSVVQLEDKDHNMLRTRHLDYNTKDSVAIFRDGGSFQAAETVNQSKIADWCLAAQRRIPQIALVKNPHSLRDLNRHSFPIRQRRYPTGI